MSVEDLKDAFIWTSILMVFNTVFHTVWDLLQHMLTGHWINEEDTKLPLVVIGMSEFKGSGDAEAPDQVKRSLRAHAHATENILPFFIVATCVYVANAGKVTDSFDFEILLMWIYVICKWLHSLCYLASFQPLRTIFFILHWVSMVILGIQALAAL